MLRIVTPLDLGGMKLTESLGPEIYEWCFGKHRALSLLKKRDACKTLNCVTRFKLPVPAYASNINVVRLPTNHITFRQIFFDGFKDAGISRFILSRAKVTSFSPFSLLTSMATCKDLELNEAVEASYQLLPYM